MSDHQDNKSKDQTERRNSALDRRLYPADRRGSERADATDAERRRDEKRRDSK